MPSVAAQPPRWLDAARPSPDPGSVRAVGELISCLRLLKVWAGDPSFAELRRRCGVPASTLADATNPARVRLPRLETVRAFVRACGAGQDLARWESAWRVVRAGGAGGPAAAHPRPAVVPRQLPRVADQVEGREEVLDRLGRLHREWVRGRRCAPVVAIVGPAGVGKTAAALHWAQRIAGGYPDGQLWIDLAPDRSGGAGAALPALLGALGVPACELPDGFAAQVGLYRSLTGSRRLLVGLDGARSAGQVRALLPAGRGCLTVVTSRDRLSGLVAADDAQRIRLGPLSPAASQRLIARLIGPERAGREPAGMVALAQLCGHLPLALRIAATQLAEAPDLPLAHYLSRLAADPLAVLALPGDESMSVAAALDETVRWLTEPARRLLHRLAAAPEPRLSGDLPAGASQLLAALAAVHLLEPVGPDRYAMPELVRRYAINLRGSPGVGGLAPGRAPGPGQLVQVAGATWTANGSSAR